MEKPKLEDYGITQEEYDFFHKNQQEFEGSLATDIIYTIILGWTMYAFTCMLAVLCGFTLSITMGKIIGYTTGFCIIGTLFYKKRKKKFIKNRNDILNTKLSTKKIEMIQKYDQALKEFKKHTKSLNKYIHEFFKIQNHPYSDLKTLDLRKIVRKIYNNCQSFENNLFDFYYDQLLIKCIGCDSFLSKIEIDEMLFFLQNSSYQKILIFSDTNIDENLISKYNNIEYVDRHKIKLLNLNITKDLIKENISNDKIIVFKQNMITDANTTDSFAFTLKDNFENIGTSSFNPSNAYVLDAELNTFIKVQNYLVENFGCKEDNIIEETTYVYTPLTC